MAFWILRNQTSLPQAITNVDSLKACHTCRSLICMCATRPSPEGLCVVEDDLDVVAIEKTGNFKGHYHILGKELKPNLSSLNIHINQTPSLKEVIIATNPTTLGDTIALYVVKYVKKNFPNLAVTRLARGIPTGADIQYADETTIESSLTNRLKL